MSRAAVRSFSREFKLKAVERLEAGESGSALSRELAVKRTRGLGGEPQAGAAADAGGQPALPAPARLRAGHHAVAACLAGLAQSRLAADADGDHQLWVADITYVRLDEEFAYLAVLLDAFSRKAIGWAMREHLRASLALEALEMALASRDVPPGGGLVHHSDRGVQYACAEYVARLTAHGIQPSMSRIACPYDNAMAESFIKTLKHEEVDGRVYRDLEQCRAAIGEFIERVYNAQRLHSALGYRSPAEYEAEHGAPAGTAPRAAAMGFEGIGKSTPMPLAQSQHGGS